MIIVAIALSVALAGPAEAQAGVIAHWKVTISGSVRHDWTLVNPAPCHASGSGSVSAHFASKRAARITIADNGYGPGDVSWDGVFHIRGQITGRDDRTRNPPDPGESPCDEFEPVPDTRGCGTRRLDDALSVEIPLRGRVYKLTDFGNFGNDLTAPNGVADCERGSFVSFATITNGGSPGRQALKLPGYPTPAALASRHGKIVVTESQRRHFIPTAVTIRRVRIVFTRTG